MNGVCPIACFSCGRELQSRYTAMQRLIREGASREDAFAKAGFRSDQDCCKANAFLNCDLGAGQLPLAVVVRWAEGAPARPPAPDAKSPDQKP